jgi:hypothetical protein
VSNLVATVLKVVEEGGEADDVLRAVVESVGGVSGASFVGIAFAEDGRLTLGPSWGEADEERRVRARVVYEGAIVGELWADGVVDHAELEQVAAVIAPYVLIGWDTGGEAWDP